MRRRWLWIVSTATAALFVFATSGAAIGTRPTVISAKYRNGLLVSRAAVYGGKDDFYGAELSRFPDRSTVTGHFSATLSRVSGLQPGPDGTVTWYLRRHLTPGRYYLRFYDDFTAAALAVADGLSPITGHAPAWNGKPMLAWSTTLSFTAG